MQSFTIKSRKNKDYNEYRTKFNTCASGMITDPKQQDFVNNPRNSNQGGANLARRGSGTIFQTNPNIPSNQNVFLQSHKPNDFSKTTQANILSKMQRLAEDPRQKSPLMTGLPGSGLQMKQRGGSGNLFETNDIRA